MKKKCKIITLLNEKGVVKTIQGNGPVQPQHLYLISDDEIKKGDWGICNKILRQCSNPALSDWNLFKKVIASTDSSLKIKSDCLSCKNVEGAFTCTCDYLPTLSESFIKAYVDSNGEIDEGEVEYVGKISNIWEATPKITDNNEVIISMIEEKMYYSKEEVLDILNKYDENLYETPYIKDRGKWIEENL